MYLASHRQPQWAMEHTELYACLGITGTRMAADFTLGPVDVVDGRGDVTRVKIIPTPEKGNCKARVLAECPHCQKWFSFGNLRQHVKVHR